MSLQSRWLQYLVAIASAGAATAIQIVLGNAVGYLYVFQALFVAVLFSAWIGGFRPALASLATGALLGAYFLLEPRESLAISHPGDQIGWVLFVVMSFGMAVLGAKMRGAQDRAEAAAHLRREEAERLRIILASIGDAVIVTDARGHVQQMNALAEELTGWQQSEAAGQPLSRVFRIINEFSRERVEDPAEKVLREGIVVGLANHTLLIAKDEAERPIDDSAAPIRTEQGSVIGVVLVFRDVTSRRKAERQLLANEERLRAALEAGRMGTWEWDIASNRVTWSEELERIHNLEPGAFPGTFEAFQNGIHPDDRAGVRARIEQTLKTGEDYQVEYRLLLPDRTTRWVEARGKLTRDAAGTPLRMIGVCMDVSQRKDAEERIRLHALVLESMTEGVSLWSRSGVIWYTNPALDRMFGYEAGELVGMCAQSLNAYPAEENERIVAAVIEQLQQQGHWEGELLNRRKDGSQLMTFARITGMDFAGEQNWLCVQENITDRKRDEENLRFLAEASRSFSPIHNYEQILNKIAELSVPRFADLCLVDLAETSGAPRRLAAAHVDRTKLEAAREYGHLYPLDPDSPLGVMRVLRTGESQLVEEITPEMLEQEAGDEQQYQLLRGLGLKSWISVPLKRPDRMIGALSFAFAESQRRFTRRDLAVAEDLARRAGKALENVRLYARLREEHRRKDEFLAMLAHELRNPLAPIRSGLELLALRGIEHETIPLMREQTSHLVRLVDDLLDMSRIMQGKIRLHREPVEMRELVQQTVDAARPLVAEQGQHVQLSLPEGPVWVRGDRVRLAQSFTNLLRNAVKYTEAGGRIWVTLRVEGEELELSVQDDGIGIDPDLLPHIFDLFIQADHSLERSKGGMGIGLTLVRNLIEAQGGRVSARSEGLGLGSEFIVRLPLGEPETEQDRPKRSDEPAPRRRVLVVDDNTGAARILGLLLTAAGSHEIEYAYDGPSALDAARRFRPEIIFLDIGLPRMSGYDVVRELRSNGTCQHTLIVALTGYGTDEDRLRSLEAGFDEHLVKPPSLEMLVELFNHPKLERVASERG